MSSLTDSPLVGSDQPTLADFVVGILAELTQDLEVGPLGLGSRLGELGLESISLVYLIAEVQQAYSLGDGLLRALRAAPDLDVRSMTVGEFAALAGTVRPVVGQDGVR